MKKYITPNMDIRIFSNLTETAESISEATPYVAGLEGIPDESKTQVTMSEMNEITKFTF